MKTIIFSLFLISGLIIQPAVSTPLSITATEAETLLNERKICPHAAYLEDRQGSLDINQVRRDGQWIKSDKKSLGFGFTPSVYWVRFVIGNSEKSDIDILVQQEYPLIDDIRMWVYSDGSPAESYHTGDLQSFSSRPYNNRTFVFPVLLRAGAETTRISPVQEPELHEHRAQRMVAG
jgi:hypothetical protein